MLKFRDLIIPNNRLKPFPLRFEKQEQPEHRPKSMCALQAGWKLEKVGSSIFLHEN